MADVEDDLFQDPRWRAFGLLREAYLSVSALVDAEVHRDGGLAPELADLLFRLARTPGHSLRTIDLTHALATTTTRTTRLVDVAEDHDYVHREPHPTDRRAVLVRLTDEGHAAAVTAGRAALHAAQRYVHDVLDDGEIAQLTRSLERLRDAAAPGSG